MPKTSIHPTHYQTKITCSCGATYTIGGTKESLKVDICRECHPFYSGNQKLIDTAGRVDRFREKMAQAQARKKGNSKKGMGEAAEVTLGTAAESVQQKEAVSEAQEENAKTETPETEVKDTE
jgi:large subunit ribosomal protein L31